MKNKDRIKYTSDHRKAFRKIEKQLLGYNTFRSLFHDLDKMFLYMFFDYKKGNNLYMVNNIEENYPNLTWAQFAICNDDATGAFEVNPQT